ncbi:MAG TPA: condensation domain-containing protein [Micromonosporaceae bacterium]|jgi:hypothetical protein|nr:condensation domain-containing protein [Micromonosporaceae bacterium]
MVEAATPGGSGKPWETPASYAQERVWFASQLVGDAPVYHLVTGIPLPYTVPADGVLAALAATVRRHEPLRTAFRLVDGELRQVVHAAVRLPVEHVDLAGRPADEVDQRVEEILDGLARVPLPLDEPPLWRAVLVNRGEADWLLLLAVHHGVFDAASEPVLRAELVEQCAAGAERRAPDLADLRVQYADWAAWQRDQLAGELDQLLDYWRRALADLPLVHGVPTDSPHPPERQFTGGDVVVDLPTGLDAAVPGVTRRLSATPFALLLAAWVALLHRLSDRDDLVVGIPVAGRDRPELAGLIGMFINIAVVRVRVPAEATYRDLVGVVRAALLDTHEHQDMPYQKLVESVVTTRLPGIAPLYQIGFNHMEQGFSRRPGAVEDDLALEVSGWRARLEYDGALFEAATAARIAADYARVLAAALTNPDMRLADLPVETPAGSQPAVAPVQPAGSTAQEWVPPRTAAEELVAGVWAEVLDRQQIGALDDFFDLGGHSLLALRVITRLSAAAEVELPIQAFFADTTVAGVAAELERLLAAELDELDEDEARRLADRSSW